jgi:hypothetical protein
MAEHLQAQRCHARSGSTHAPWRCGALVTALLLFVSCGGGGGGAPTETVNGIAVPPAPDAASNAGTLSGVDSNGNALRDDVERTIAQRAPNQAAYDASVPVAAAVQALYTEVAPNRAVAMTKVKAFHCAVQAAVQAGVEPVAASAALLNTQARVDAYNANAALVGGFDSSELGECT